jgi:hypothetical protein
LSSPKKSLLFTDSYVCWGREVVNAIK